MNQLKNKKLTYIIFCFMLLSCGSNSKPQFDISEKGDSIIYYGIAEKQDPNAPEFQFEEISYNFGEIIQGEQMNYTFFFKNVGKQNLIIYNVETSCGCTTSTYSKEPIKTGENGEIEIIFDTKNKIGEVNTYILVTANTYPGQVMLTLSANVMDK
jgi:hypothetical protein